MNPVNLFSLGLIDLQRLTKSDAELWELIRRISSAKAHGFTQYVVDMDELHKESLPNA